MEGRQGNGELQLVARTAGNSYIMDARALAYLLHEGAKRPRAINELSA